MVLEGKSFGPKICKQRSFCFELISLKHFSIDINIFGCYRAMKKTNKKQITNYMNARSAFAKGCKPFFFLYMYMQLDESRDIKNNAYN